MYLTPQIFRLATLPACNHFRTAGLHVSRAQPCSSVSNLAHSNYLMFNLPLTKSSQDRQTLQNSDEKPYCHSCIA